MSSDSFKVKNSLNIDPKASPTMDQNGDIAVDSSTNKLKVRLNGTTENVASEAYVDAHINDATAAHAASAIAFTPAGTIAASDVQTAVAEVATDAASALSTHESDTTNIHGIADTSILVTTTGAQVLTNKDFDGGTASNTSRVTLPKAAKATLDALTRKEATLVYASDTDKLYYDDGSILKLVGSGAGGETNFITDGDAEGAQILTVYNDSSTTRPVDGTGGTQANLAVSISSSSPLIGTNSFLFTKSGSASTQGSGASIPFTIDSAYKAKVLQIEFDYIVNSGTFVAGSSSAESDVIVYLYDVTNSTLIEPSSIKLLSNSSTISDKFTANFQTSATGTSYRLILHCQSTSTANYALKLDNITVKPSRYVYGTPITDWVSYTPTGSWSTNTTYTGRWRRVGDSLESDVLVSTSGAPTTSTLAINLPSGLTIDTAKTAGGTDTDSTTYGNGVAKDAGTNNYASLKIGYNNSTSVVVYTLNTAGTYAAGTPVNQVVPFTFGASDAVNIRYSVPISGWSSSTQVSDGYDGRLIVAHAYRASSSQNINSASDVKIQWNGETKDTTSSFDSATNYRFTAPSQGTYQHSGIIGLATSTANIATLYLYKNGSQHKYLGSVITSASVSTSIPFSVEADANASDYFEIYLNSNSASQNVVSDAAAPGGSQWYISKLQTPTTISATEVVAAFYNTSAGQTIATATDSVVNFGTLVDDTHNAVTTGAAWKFTCPVAGKYFVSTGVVYVTQFTTVGSTILIGVRKNSSLVFQKRRSPYATTGGPYYDVSVSGYVNCNAGDTIDVMLNQNDGGNRLLTTTALENFVSIYRIK